MGKLRSKDGCLTCRSRRVKCDEQRPVCGNCWKGRRECRREARQEAQIRFHDAIRRSPQQQSETPEEMSPQTSVRQDSVVASGSMSISQLLQPASVSPAASVVVDTPQHISIPMALARHEAWLMHYYALHLGRWLDCTDASRQFTLKIPRLATTSPVLLQAIMSFAARHAGDTEAANLAHERCIEMLIVQLDSGQVADDDALLCAIVILRVFEQLTAVGNGSDQERHLAGCSALLRACQGPCVDPSAPGLREAAFWVYMRQCLYNACINHQAPNMDFSLTLLPIPGLGTGAAAHAHALLSETAWANSMTWICATVVQFCFGSNVQQEPTSSSNRTAKWQELGSAVESWAHSRPPSFDPIWQGDSGKSFPDYYFAADWHLVAFGYYHLACMLLILYKPTPPRFAIRSARSTSGDRAQILEHARAMCGACQSEPSNVPARIALCHSVFLWGALLDDACERSSLMRLLQELEREHAWPTAWVVSALREEWGM